MSERAKMSGEERVDRPKSKGVHYVKGPMASLAHAAFWAIQRLHHDALLCPRPLGAAPSR